MFRGSSTEDGETRTTEVEQGSQTDTNAPLASAYPQTKAEMGAPPPSFETDKKNQLRGEIDLLRGYLQGNPSIPNKTRASIMERLSKLDEHVGSSWMSSTSSNQLDNILGKTPELRGFQQNLGSVEGLINGLELKEKSGQTITDADVSALAQNAAELIQTYPQYREEDSRKETKQKGSTLFKVFKTVTGVKSEEDYSDLSEKDQAKVLQKEALKHLTLFERIFLSISVNFLHKGDAEWLKNHLFKKINIPYLAKMEILKFFYPDRDPNTLREVEKEKIEAPRSQKMEREETRAIPKETGHGESPLPVPEITPKRTQQRIEPERPVIRQREKSQLTPIIPRGEVKPKAEEERQIRQAEAISKTRSLEQLIENRTDKEKLDIFGESLLGDVTGTSEKINELMLDNLNRYDIPIRLNGLTNQVNKLIYECGIIPSEEEIDSVFTQIRESPEFKPGDKLQSDIVEGSIKQMIHIRTAENQLMNIWINEAVNTAKSRDGKEVVNGDLVEQIFTQKLIDHIIDYRMNLPEGQKGRIGSLQEAEVLKKEFAKSIEDRSINVEFYQVGQIHVPVLLIDDYEKQASLYGSTNPTDRDKVSPGRFFFDGKLTENETGIEVPSLVSTVSFVTEDYREHPELIKHEIIHATHELQQHAQREIFRETYQKKTLKSNLVGESLIKFILSGETETQVDNLRTNNIEVPEQTQLLAEEIRTKYSSEEIQYFITGGYQLDSEGEFSKAEVTKEVSENAKSIRETIKTKSIETPLSQENQGVNATQISADLMQNYIETGTSGVPEFDEFIQENHQLNNHVTKIGEVYNRFYNPVNEAVTTYVSSDRNVGLGDLQITNFDKNNPELIGGLALVRLLNGHNGTRNGMASQGNIENFIKEKELLATYLNSSPLYKNGRVTIGSMMDILSYSLENEDDPIHDLLNVIIPNQDGDIDQDYLNKLRETIPLLDRWMGDGDLTSEQYRILKFLFPMGLLEDFDTTLELESVINDEDNGIGKAINPDPLLRHAVTNTYVAAEFGPNVSPNARSGQTYGGKTDYFTRPYMPKDPGNQLLQFWGWTSKTFTDGFGLGSSKKFRLDSIDPLEAIAFATGLPIHRLPFLENLREKMLTQDAYYPDTYVSPSPRAYTAGVFKEIFGAIQKFGRLDDMSAITLMTKIGGYNFNLQGQPSLSNETWIHPDEYRNNDALAAFISRRVPEMENKLRRDFIEADGNVIDVEKFQIGQMSKGYLKDILESMVMGGYPIGGAPINKWGHAMIGYDKGSKTMDNNLRKRDEFERIGKIMMAADHARNVQVVTHEDGTTTEEYTGKKAYTLFDLYEAINTAQLEMPESIYFNSSGQKRTRDEVIELEKIYMKQDFTIKIDGVNVGLGITGPKDKGLITLKDAKEFLEFAIIARAERVANIGVWGKKTKRDPFFNRIPVPIHDQNALEDFINSNGFVPEDNTHLKRGDELYEIIVNPQNQTAELCRVTEEYHEDAEIKTGAKVYGNVDLKMKHIDNFSPEQMLFFFGKKETYQTIDANRVVHNIEARRSYKLNEGLIYDSVFDELDKINQGKKLSFQFSLKLLQTDRYREFSKAQMEFWSGIRNIDSFYRFVIIAASAVGALVPGMAFLANPGLFVGLMAWSLIASPLINRQANGWQAKMMAAIEAQGDIIGYADRFNNLANEEHPPSFGDLDLARTQMETVKYKWRTVLTNMSKNAKWDTNVFTNIFNQMWGKVT